MADSSIFSAFWQWQTVCVVLSLLVTAFHSSHCASNLAEDPLAVGYPERIPGDEAEAGDRSSFLGLAVIAEGNPRGGEGPVPKGEGFPNFGEAQVIWSGWWFSHVYGLGSLFALMGLLCVAALCMADAGYLRDTVLARVVLASLALFSISRAVLLLVDPYGARQIFPTSLVQVLMGLSLPTMSCSYGMLLATLVSATSFQARPLLLFQQRKLLYAILIVLLLGYLAAEVLVYEFGVMNVILVICQSTFVAWGLFMATSFAYMGFKISHKMKDLKRVRTSKTKKSKDMIIRTAAISCFLGLAFIASHIYILASNEIGDVGASAEPWPWYYCATALRIIELLMTCSLFHIVLGSPMTCSVWLDLLCCRNGKVNGSTSRPNMGTRTMSQAELHGSDSEKVSVKTISAWSASNPAMSVKCAVRASMDSIASCEDEKYSPLHKESITTQTSDGSNSDKSAAKYLPFPVEEIKDKEDLSMSSTETNATWSPPFTGSPEKAKYESSHSIAISNALSHV